MTEPLDMRARYEHALAEVAEMKRALAERARHVAELEQQLMRQVEEGARESRRKRTPTPAPAPAAPEPTESDLARAVAEAKAEKALAQAERERLEERERNIRKVERELASLRVDLEEERRRATASAPLWPGEQPSAGASGPEPGSAPTARRRTTR